MSSELFLLAMERLNEALTAATVIVATSMLLYNLMHGFRDRVVRTSSLLLGCVSVVYIGDVFVALSTNASAAETWLRFQWIGIAFTPATVFHLSDALLATTGLVSRGRRRRIIRLLYLFGIVFLLTAVFTNLIIRDMTYAPLPMMQAGPLFWIYALYFFCITIFAFNNVLRARRRCLTAATHRRMTYLLMVFLSPAAGIFPYSLLFSNPGTADAGLLALLNNLGNLGIAVTLTFMAYPLSFFGANRPDRVVKAELLHFMLRGPVIGVAVLLAILFIPATRVFGLPGVEFMPFAVVAIVLLLQWSITLGLPYLERELIYGDDEERSKWLREISQRMMTREDSHQMLESTLAAVCDYLRVPSAFVASISNQGVRLEQVIGPLRPAQSWLSSPEFLALDSGDNLPADMQRYGDNLFVWQSFWLIPLRSERTATSNGYTNGYTNGHNHNNGTGNTHRPLIGVMGVWARAAQPNLLPDEEKIFAVLVQRAAHVLEGMRIQDELFASVEKVLTEAEAMQYEPDPVRFGNAATLTRPATTGSAFPEPDFIELIKGALRDYWGGPGLTDTRLLSLKVVVEALRDNDGNPAKAVRAVLSQAIESFKPEGQRSMNAPEWTLYNILEMRFVQGKKVAEVRQRLSISDANLYRKQNLAIEQVAQKIAGMENDSSQGTA